METKPTPEEYAAACAVVKRMQDVVMEKFLLTLKRHERKLKVIIGMPEICPDVVRFHVLFYHPFVGEGNSFLRSGTSLEQSFPTVWLDMPNEDIERDLQEEEGIQNLNEERLGADIKIQPYDGHEKATVFDGPSMNFGIKIGANYMDWENYFPE